MNDENFFVGIDESQGLRKSILESSKQIILVLKSQQKIVALRGKKLGLVNELRSQIKELTLLLSKLETKMPPHDIFKDLKLEGFDIKPEEPKKPVAEEKQYSAEMQDLDRLEKALGAIEQKLSRLKD